jgi:hypothetical protein
MHSLEHSSLHSHSPCFFGSQRLKNKKISTKVTDAKIKGTVNETAFGSFE